MTDPSRPRRRLISKTISVPGNFDKACRDFNEGRFFECHEWFEEIWQEEQGDVRDLYKGLIQLAAAFVHLSKGNFVGADRLLRTGIGYLKPYRPEGAMGFDVESISEAAQAMHLRLLTVGRPGVETLDLTKRPLYAFDRDALPAEARRWQAWGFDREGNALQLEITVPS